MTTSNVAELLLPAIRWDAVRGFDAARPVIEQGIARGVGGFILFGGPQELVRALTKELRQRSRVPLLIGADLERGAGQQFEGATGLPPLAAIASLGELETIYRAARLTAREARTLGVNWDYAPVCDLDLNPENPIVGTRSFGDDPARVSRMVAEWITACQAEGVLACAKHFPGHGRTTGDSHAELPVVNASRHELLESDLKPFRAAIEAGVASIMTAHVAYPALDPGGPGVPATLSTEILRVFLRERLRFDNLIVTDALIMEGVLAGESEGEGGAAVRALTAGCDLLLYPQDLDGVIARLQEALASGRLDAELVNRSRRRRLKWAQWASPPSDYRRASGADVNWGNDLCERVIHVLRGRVPDLPSGIDVLVVDDDVGGPYPPPSRDPLFAALRAVGIGARRVDLAGATGQHRVVDAGGGAASTATSPLVIALFGDVRAWKKRPGYSADSRRAVEKACAAALEHGRTPLVLQFSHPRLAAEIPAAPNVVSAWGGDRCMQEAVARWLRKGARN